MSDSPALPPSDPKRDAGWHFKWVFASYATGFALSMLVALCSIPVFGFSAIEFLVSPAGGVAVTVAAAVISPVVYRRLK